MEEIKEIYQWNISGIKGVPSGVEKMNVIQLTSITCGRNHDIQWNHWNS